MASFRVYGKGHSIRARGLTRVPTYPVYLPYPERVIPPGHETPKIYAYFNIRINSGLFSSIREGSFHQGTRENPRSKTFPLILISGNFQGSFRVYGKGHSIRAREKTETPKFSAYLISGTFLYSFRVYGKGHSIRARGMTSDLFRIRCISEAKWVAPSGTRILVGASCSSIII